MPNSSIFNSRQASLIKRAGLFIAGLVLFYLLILLVLTHIRPLSAFGTEHYRDFNLHQLVARNYSFPGWSGQSLRRFREIKNYSDIDILFIGSSHCIRSFDPRTFDRLGVTSFVMGSNSQAPLNTYYLLKKYYEQLNPKLVVFEVYPGILEFDGLEGYYDLLVNQHLSMEMAEMAVAVNNPQAINAVISRAVSSLTDPIDNIGQNEISNETYVKGGYLSAEVAHVGDDFGPRRDIDVSDTQIEYVHQIIDLVKSSGAEMLMMVAPIPRERRAAMTNYNEVSSQINAIADQHKIRFYDFNGTLSLDSRNQFRDGQHLNANGARILSYALIDSLLDVEEFHDALAVPPELAADMYCGRGIMLASDGKLEEAIIEYGRAIELMPDNYEAYINRALAFSEKEDFDAAIADFRRAAAIDPQSGEVYFNVARVYEKAGMNNEAVMAYSLFMEVASVEFAQYVEPVRQRVEALKRQ